MLDSVCQFFFLVFLYGYSFINDTGLWFCFIGCRHQCISYREFEFSFLFCALKQFIQHGCPVIFEGLAGFCETIWTWSFFVVCFSVSSIETGLLLLSHVSWGPGMVNCIFLGNPFLQDFKLQLTQRSAEPFLCLLLKSSSGYFPVSFQSCLPPDSILSLSPFLFSLWWFSHFPAVLLFHSNVFCLEHLVTESSF